MRGWVVVRRIVPAPLLYPPSALEWERGVVYVNTCILDEMNNGVCASVVVVDNGQLSGGQEGWSWFRCVSCKADGEGVAKVATSQHGAFYRFLPQSGVVRGAVGSLCSNGSAVRSP